MSYRYFKPDEFQWCTPACRIEDMSPKLMSMLDQAREIAGCPFILNSAYRSKAYELSHGRKGTSSHSTLDENGKPCCKAVDISCMTGPIRRRIVFALIEVGFTRIGLSKSYIHVDIDSDKPDSIWIY